MNCKRVGQARLQKPSVHQRALHPLADKTPPLNLRRQLNARDPDLFHSALRVTSLSHFNAGRCLIRMQDWAYKRKTGKGFNALSTARDAQAGDGRTKVWDAAARRLRPTCRIARCCGQRASTWVSLCPAASLQSRHRIGGYARSERRNRSLKNGLAKRRPKCSVGTLGRFTFTSTLGFSLSRSARAHGARSSTAHSGRGQQDIAMHPIFGGGAQPHLM